MMAGVSVWKSANMAPKVRSYLTTKSITNSLLFVLVATCSIMSYYQMIKFFSGKTTVARSVDTRFKEVVSFPRWQS